MDALSWFYVVAACGFGGVCVCIVATARRRPDVGCVEFVEVGGGPVLGQRELELLAAQFARDVLSDPAKRRVMASMIEAVERAEGGVRPRWEPPVAV